MNKPLRAIFWGGLTCGVLDLTSAFVAWGLMGIRPILILQSIATGWLGPKSFHGGYRTAVLGFASHFLIAFTAAAIYYLASRKLAFMTTRAVLSGLLYGEAVHVFMNFVVLPLSAHGGRAPYTWAQIVTGPILHPVLVGLPIALAVRRYAGAANSRVLKVASSS